MLRGAHTFVVLFGLLWAAAGRVRGEEPSSVAAELSGLRKRVEAQDETIRKLRGDLDAQDARIGALSGGSDSLDAEVERYLAGAGEQDVALRYGSGTSLVSIHGFLDQVFRDDSATHSDIDQSHAFLFLHAPVGEIAGVWLEVEYEHASEEIELDQAEVRFTPFDADLTLAAGRFYAPVGVERFTWYPSTNHLVTRPIAFQQVVPGNWYATGVRADWKHALCADLQLRVEASLSDGLGPSAATDIRGARQFRDSNNNKAVAGRVGITWRKDLTFGISGATQDYKGGNSISFLAVDFEGRWRGLLVRSEFVQSDVEDPSGPTGSFRRRGLYLLAAYRAFEREDAFVDLVARYEWADLNSKVADGGDLSAVSLGARWSPVSHVSFKGEMQWQFARFGMDPPRDWAFFLQAVVDF